MRTWIFLLILISLFSCRTESFINRNGEEFKLPPSIIDALIDSSTISSHSFLLEEFINQEFSDSLSVQYVFPTNIKDVLKDFEELLIILYYPTCKSSTRYLNVAEYAENNNIPFILISFVSRPTFMHEWNKEFNFKNTNAYIFPSSSKYSNKVFEKKIQFVKELCPNCYIELQDEILFTSYIILKKHGQEVHTNINEKISDHDKVIKWIHQLMKV